MTVKHTVGGEKVLSPNIYVSNINLLNQVCRIYNKATFSERT
jgi:hypothetical protein